MSAIFKDRKVPRHLIIEDDHELRFRRRHRLGWWFSVVLLLGMLVFASFQLM